jgi:hypothetical protein
MQRPAKFEVFTSVVELNATNVEPTVLRHICIFPVPVPGSAKVRVF